MSRGIHPTDEGLLDWYFGRGQAAFERSTCGPMLDRAKLFSLKKDPDEPETPAERARRHRRRPKPKKPTTGTDQANEGGKTAHSGSEKKWDPLEHYYSTGLTARPTGGHSPEVRDAPNDKDLFRYAEASRRVSAIAAVDPTAAAVLQAYYGDQGARWGRTELGRIVAVIPLTEAGRELLRRADERSKKRGGKASTAPEAEQVATELHVLRVQPAASRGVLAERARNQALALYARALSLWRASKRTAVERPVAGAQRGERGGSQTRSDSHDF